MSKKKTEETVYQIRLDKHLHQAYLDTAKANDRSGAVLIRDFMRQYVKKNGQGTLKL